MARGLENCPRRNGHRRRFSSGSPPAHLRGAEDLGRKSNCAGKRNCQSEFRAFGQVVSAEVPVAFRPAGSWKKPFVRESFETVSEVPSGLLEFFRQDV